MTELLHDRGRDRGKVIDEGEVLHSVMLNLKDEDYKQTRIVK